MTVCMHWGTAFESFIVQQIKRFTRFNAVKKPRQSFNLIINNVAKFSSRIKIKLKISNIYTATLGMITKSLIKSNSNSEKVIRLKAGNNVREQFSQRCWYDSELWYYPSRAYYL